MQALSFQTDEVRNISLCLHTQIFTMRSLPGVSKTKNSKTKNEAPYFILEDRFEQRQKPYFLLLST